MIIFPFISSRSALFVIASACVTTTMLHAQPKFNSPYSRFGLGDLTRTTLIQQNGMAGAAIGYSDPIHLNSSNPSALSSLQLTAFEGGLFTQGSTYRSRSKSNRAIYGNLSYLALGFTLKNTINEALEKNKSKNRIGMGLFLEPVSNIGYDITSNDTISTEQIISNQYQGEGGLYRFKYGTAIRRKNTSIGAFLGWQFGKAIFENTTRFDTLPAFQNNFRDEIYTKGFVYALGAQHDIVLAYSQNNKDVPSRFLTLGVTGSAMRRIGISTNQLRIRSRGRTANGSDYIDADTLLNKESVRGKVTLPAQMNVGLMYTHVNKLRLGADINFAGWSSYTNSARPDTLKSTLGIAVGGEYTPDHLAYNKYMKRTHYRFGVYYRQDPRVVAQKQLTDVGLSLGLGLPLILPRQGTSALHLSLELGKLGGGSLIEENYWRVSLGYTLNDNSWFFKRRFD